MHKCICSRCFNGSIYDKWEFEHNSKEFRVQVKSSLILNDTLLMLDAAVAGAGIAYSTEAAIKDKVRSEKLEIVLNQYAASSTGFYLYYPNPSQTLPKLRVFIDHIKGELKRIQN